MTFINEVELFLNIKQRLTVPLHDKLISVISVQLSDKMYESLDLVLWRQLIIDITWEKYK